MADSSTNNAAPSGGSAHEREVLIYRAKLAEQAERYDEMAEYMNDVARLDPMLSTEERNLLSVAYKNAVGARRASWRVITSIEQKQLTRGNMENVELAAEYRRKVEKELMDVCHNILNLLEQFLVVPNAKSVDTQVFFYKMRGDYYRYIAEFSEDKKEAATNARAAYEEAYQFAKQLPATHPIHLGLALNYSVFHYEIMNDPKQACAMAQKAFDDAIRELDNVSEESYRDSTLIMQLLRDNLTLWTADVPGAAPEPAGAGNEGDAKDAAGEQEATKDTDQGHGGEAAVSAAS